MGLSVDIEILLTRSCSTFTPVPTRVQDGSEDILPAAVLSGAPLELQARTVRYATFVGVACLQN